MSLFFSHFIFVVELPQLDHRNAKSSVMSQKYSLLQTFHFSYIPLFFVRYAEVDLESKIKLFFCHRKLPRVITSKLHNTIQILVICICKSESNIYLSISLSFQSHNMI